MNDFPFWNMLWNVLKAHMYWCKWCLKQNGSSCIWITSGFCGWGNSRYKCQQMWKRLLKDLKYVIWCEFFFFTCSRNEDQITLALCFYDGCAAGVMIMSTAKISLPQAQQLSVTYMFYRNDYAGLIRHTTPVPHLSNNISWCLFVPLRG